MGWGGGPGGVGRGGVGVGVGRKVANQLAGILTSQSLTIANQPGIYTVRGTIGLSFVTKGSSVTDASSYLKLQWQE